MRRIIRLGARGSFLSIALAGISAAQTGSWTIDTLAGTRPPVNDGGTALTTVFTSPSGIATDSSGSLYFSDADDHRVRKIDSKGIVTTIAGNGVSGYTGDGGTATDASLTEPRGLAFDAAGSLYIADSGASVIRKVSPEGVISTVAGTGVRGFGSTQLNLPYALAFDSKGALYIGEGSAVGILGTDGTINPLTAGSLPLLASLVEGLAFDSAGNLYVSSFGDQRIYKITPDHAITYLAGTGQPGFSGDGGPATAAQFNGPKGLAVDSTGGLWVCDSGNSRIRRIGTDGSVVSVIGSGYFGYNGDQNNPLSVSLGLPDGIVFDKSGSLFWTEQQNQIVRRLPSGSTFLARIAGTPFAPVPNMPATSLIFRDPHGVSTDLFGNAYVADTRRHAVWKISSTGLANIFAGTGVPGSAGEFGTAAAVQLNQPMGVTADGQGNVYIADTGNARILKVDANGGITRFLGEVPVVINGAQIAPGLGTPTGVKSDATGNVLVTDSTLNGVVGAIVAGPASFYPGSVSPPVADLKQPMNAVYAGPFPVTTFDMYPPSGPTAIIADTGNHSVVRTTGSAMPRRLAGNGGPGYYGDGGPAAQAGLSSPSDVAIDANGNIFIADTGNNRIRMIDSNGNISTIAGNGQAGFSGDKGPALSARLNAPTSVNVDSLGGVEIADLGNQRIRVLHFVQSGPDFGVALDANSKTINRGLSGTFSISLSSLVGFSGFVTVSASAPTGVTVSFSPADTVAVVPNQDKSITATITVPVAQSTGAMTVTFTATAGTLKHTLPATVVVTDQPHLTAAGIVNAASYYSGAVSPGEIVAIFGDNIGPVTLASGTFDDSGSLSNTAGNTRVLFDGIAAPIVYAQAGQVAAIAPYAIAGQSSTAIQVEYNGQRSAAVTMPVIDASPSLFNLPSSDQAAALNEDLTVNGPNNPAAAGSIVVLFGTGEGQTNPPGVDGLLATSTPLPAPLRPLALTIGGRSAQTVYAAAAPSEVAGLFQINARVPAGLTPGKVMVVVISGTRVGTSFSTIYVK